MTPPHGQDRGDSRRAVGMAMIGSAVALLAVTALASAGVLAFDAAVRPWVAAGTGVAAVLDGMLGLYFLRAASQS